MAVGGSVKMKADRGGELQDEVACLGGQMRVKPARIAFAGVVELSTISNGSTYAALRLPWSQGVTEGKVNKLKTLKRVMYGRAGFALLRQQLLHDA